MDERRRSQVAALVGPKSVALLGASSDSRILGGRPLAILGQHDWTGPIYPVHPTRDEIGGRPAYRTIADVPGPVDLAVFLVPPPVVPELLDQCGAAGVTTSYIITSGFGEAPEGDGRRLDTALREACARWPGMGVAGPNGEGVFDVAGDFALSFSPTVDYERGLAQRPVPGTIAVVAQSGGIGFGIFNQGTARGLRFSKVVSTGNEVDLEALDYVEYLLEDPATSVIALFIEGFKNPGRLRPVARRALELGKPIVIMKVGRSVQAQRTAVSHTGHLTGRSDLYSALFADFGITEVRSMDELLDVAGAMATTGPVAGRRVGVFTASGGAGLWVVDACAEHGLDVPELPAAEQAGILARLPYYASASNPVDYTAGASDEHGVTAALAGLAGSSSVDVVVLVMSLTVAAGLADRVRPLVDLVAAAGKPLVVQSYTHPVPEAVAVLADFKIPWFVNQQGLGRTLAALADRHDAERRPTESAADRARPSAGTAERVVPEHAVKAWLRDAGLPVPDGRLVGTEAEALAAGAELGYPVVVKLQSAEVSHKSDVGAVVVGVAGPDELIGAYHQVVAAAPVGQPIDGVLVEGMVTAGREMMIGVIGDPDLGPFVVIGSGGADAELAADTQILTAPVTTEAARAAIGRLRAARGLSGWRGGPPADVTALAELVAAVSRWVLDLDDEVAELDLNPVILHPAGQGVDIVDGLAVVRSPVAASE